MTALQAYLQNSNTRKVLSKKPGEAGFSLIELVVVVAVLAVLSAIAIPAFTNISEKARASAAANTMATIAKECAVKLADTGAGTYNVPTLDGYRGTGFGWTQTTVNAGTCSNASNVVMTLTSSDTTKYPTFTYNMNSGVKTCTASGEALNRGCPASGGSW